MPLGALIPVRAPLRSFDAGLDGHRSAASCGYCSFHCVGSHNYGSCHRFSEPVDVENPAKVRGSERRRRWAVIVGRFEEPAGSYASTVELRRTFWSICWLNMFWVNR